MVHVLVHVPSFVIGHTQNQLISLRGCALCERRCQGQLEKVSASNNHIPTCNVSVVRINGNIIRVGAPRVSSYDVTRFGARARVFEPCKGSVAACFGAH